MKTIGLRICLAVVLCLAAFASVCAAAPVVGSKMPAFTLNNLGGQPVTVAPAGKILIVNFWATWCPPCRREMPELNAYYLDNRDEVVFYAVNLQEPPNKVNDFMYRNGYSIPTLVDTDGAAGSLFRIQAIPTTIIVDRKGIIQYYRKGAITRAELEDMVNRL